MDATTHEHERTGTPHRLVRRRADRKIAGVAAGLAEHFRLDPLWIRLGFVITTFAGGLGLVAYIALWILMPVTDEPLGEDAYEARELSIALGGGSLPVIVMVIGLLILATPLIDDHPGVVWGAALVALGLYLFRDRDDAADAPERDRGPASHEPVSGPAAPASQGTRVDAPGGSGPTRPHAVAPRAPRRRPRRRERSPLSAIAFGVMFVVLGLMWLIDSGSGADLRLVHYLATALLIFGVALAVGSFAGRARVLILPGLLLLPLTAVAGLADVAIDGGVGEREITPRAASEIESPYRYGIGRMVLDLRQVPVAPGGDPIEIEATVGIGSLDVEVPFGVPVDVRARVGLGEVSIAGRDSGGAEIDILRRIGPAGATPAFVLDLRTGIGEVTVGLVPTTEIPTPRRSLR